MNRTTRLLITAASLVAILALVGCDLSSGGPVGPTENQDLGITVQWNSEVADVDLYVTYPYPTDRNPINNDGTPVYSYVAQAYDGPIIGGDVGFVPEDGDAERQRVYVGAPTSSEYSRLEPTKRAVELVAHSASAGGAETIVVRDLPFLHSGLDFNTTPNYADNRLGAGADYAWLGVMEVYVYGQSAPLATTGGGGAAAVVTIRNSAGAVVGQYAVPRYTDIRGMAIARIVLFRARDGFEYYNYYQILPDARLVTDSGQIRSIVGDAAVDIASSGRPDGVITVRGRLQEVR